VRRSPGHAGSTATEVKPKRPTTGIRSCASRSAAVAFTFHSFYSATGLGWRLRRATWPPATTQRVAAAHPTIPPDHGVAQSGPSPCICSPSPFGSSRSHARASQSRLALRPPQGGQPPATPRVLEHPTPPPPVLSLCLSSSPASASTDQRPQPRVTTVQTAFNFIFTKENLIPVPRPSQPTPSSTHPTPRRERPPRRRPRKSGAGAPSTALPPAMRRSPRS